MLTKRQKEVLDYVAEYNNSKSYSPSLEEIREKFKFASVSTAHFHISSLEELGYLKKVDNKPRSIEVYENEEMVKIPLLGMIAAGNPIEAIEQQEYIAVPRTKLPTTKDIYSLRVKGSSMIDENINDGDIVIIKSQSVANNGDRVVALLNGNEVTLKKYFKEKKNIRLQPANKEMQPLILSPDQVVIQGIVITVIKDIPLEDQYRVNRVVVKPVEEIKKASDLPINKIIAGDALREMKKLPDDSVDLIIADPPYNLSQGNTLKWESGADLPGMGGNWEKVMQGWDNMPLSEYILFTKLWVEECKRILKPTGSIWIFGTYHNIGIINLMFQTSGIEIINEVIWYKRNSFPNLSGRRLTASHETLLWGHAGGKKRKYFFDYQESKDFHEPSDLLKNQGKQMRTVWDIPNNKKKEELRYGKHPTQKPLSVCKRIVSISSRPGDIVLSPFAGSGSECIAAKELGRNYLGFELDPEYVELARTRLENCIQNTTAQKESK